MAKQLVKLEDLKAAFGDFDKMSELVDKVYGQIDHVNKVNRTAAGSDEIGKQYHEKVDEPTTNLLELVGGIRDKLARVAKNGMNVADLFDSTDEHNAGLVK
ncbi:hypothetical protein ACFVHI_24385 [Kitasatospora sp. NPDC127121]|uniref:hypothetical protein n=1 Tax=unclassified Kitasatospora TaxID=2633591 RepID=UPI003637AE4E